MKQKRIYSPGADDENAAIRTLVEEGIKYFEGYAAVFNKQSRIIFERGKTFIEVINRGAFDNVLKDQNIDVVLTLDHVHFYNLGRTISGNLTLTADEIGLKFRAKVPNTQAGNDTYEMVSRGDFTDCSFSFTVDSDGETWTRNEEGKLLHIVNRVSGLYDVTICTLYGAYGDTEINTELVNRKYKELIEGGADLEEIQATERENTIKADHDRTKIDLLKRQIL